MKKKYLMALLAVSLSLMGCMHTRDISGRADYANVIGAKYALNTDCYVVRFTQSPQEILVSSPIRDKALPESVDPQYIHQHFGMYIILGILKKGEVFTVVGAEEEKSPVDTFIRLKAKFENPSFNGLTLGVFLLTDDTKSPPVFLTNLVSQLSN